MKTAENPLQYVSQSFIWYSFIFKEFLIRISVYPASEALILFK